MKRMLTEIVKMELIVKLKQTMWKGGVVLRSKVYEQITEATLIEYISMKQLLQKDGITTLTWKLGMRIVRINHI